MSKSLAAAVLVALSWPAAADEFSRPRPVAILGYTGNAMEPFISKDGNYLFFNNSNDPAEFTDLYFAKRTSRGSFVFAGRLAGANAPPPSLDAVASMDAHGVFYFISSRVYGSTLKTLHAGIFQGDRLASVTLVPGDVAVGAANWATMDAEISADGGTLYFADAYFDGGPLPAQSDLALAHREGEGSFRRDTNSAAILLNINSADLEYAPSISADGLELFFTRYSIASRQFGIWRSRRASIADAFAPAEYLTSFKGFVEAPTLSADGRTMYFHKKVGGKYVIFRATR